MLSVAAHASTQATAASAAEPPFTSIRNPTSVVVGWLAATPAGIRAGRVSSLTSRSVGPSPRPAARGPSASAGTTERYADSGPPSQRYGDRCGGTAWGTGGADPVRAELGSAVFAVGLQL